MSRLLLQPATWPHLALNPEPMGTSMDPDSIQRWYQELFGGPEAPCQWGEPATKALRTSLEPLQGPSVSRGS